jgi:hypothetical protein
MAIDELVQMKEPEPLPIGLKDLQPIKFEPVNNHFDTW